MACYFIYVGKTLIFFRWSQRKKLQKSWPGLPFAYSACQDFCRHVMDILNRLCFLSCCASKTMCFQYVSSCRNLKEGKLLAIHIWNPSKLTLNSLCCSLMPDISVSIGVNAGHFVTDHPSWSLDSKCCSRSFLLLRHLMPCVCSPLLMGGKWRKRVTRGNGSFKSSSWELLRGFEGENLMR